MILLSASLLPFENECISMRRKPLCHLRCQNKFIGFEYQYVQRRYYMLVQLLVFVVYIRLWSNSAPSRRRQEKIHIVNCTLNRLIFKSVFTELHWLGKLYCCSACWHHSCKLTAQIHQLPQLLKLLSWNSSLCGVSMAFTAAEWLESAFVELQF